MIDYVGDDEGMYKLQTGCVVCKRLTRSLMHKSSLSCVLPRLIACNGCVVRMLTAMWCMPRRERRCSSSDAYTGQCGLRFFKLKIVVKNQNALIKCIKA